MLTQSDRDILGYALTKLAFAYGSERTKEQVRGFIEALLEFAPGASLEDYQSGISNYANDRKNKFFPTPMAVRDYMNSAVGNETKAKEAASRVLHAVHHIGYVHPQKAREYIGELGWHAVQRFGGWNYICENLGLDLSVTTFQAQIREVCLATTEMQAVGIFNQPVHIGNRPPSQQLQSAGEVLGLKAPEETKSIDELPEEKRKEIESGFAKFGIDPKKLLGSKL